MCLAKIFIVIFAPDERLPSSATLSGLQLSSDPQSELCPKNGFLRGSLITHSVTIWCLLDGYKKSTWELLVGDHLETNDEKCHCDTSALWCL